MTAKTGIETPEDSNAVSVESTDLFGIRRPLLCVDRPWSAYPLGTKAHSCMGGWWLRTERGWQWNGKHGTFPTPGGEACGACIELPLSNAYSPDARPHNKQS
jgi:hypothetical protein